MTYSAVHVFGDSLVDSGNVLKLAEFVDNLPLSSLPDGTPTADKGYYLGRFSNGLNFADLFANKFLGVSTQPVFPFGYEDPLLGITFPFEGDPEGNNLNFAYGGARILDGGVPDLDDQTDAYRDAVDRHVDLNALHLITIGGNDIRKLVPDSGAIADTTTAHDYLQKAAQELQAEISELIAIGARHFVVTGMPDVGIIPDYDGLVDEAARRTAATQYSALLDGMIQSALAALRTAYPAVQLHFVSLTEATATILANLEQIYAPADLYPLDESELIFFDHVHPTAQVHALLAASILDTMSGTPAGESIALTAPDFSLNSAIAASGEADRIVIAVAANVSYQFEALGISSGSGTLADPLLRILGTGGIVAAADDDGGLGLDASFSFAAAQANSFVVEVAGSGSLSGTYRLQASAEANGDNLYYVTDNDALILESPGEGHDTVLAGVSYRLGTGVSIEELATAYEPGTAGLYLIGNEFNQAIIGNAGDNRLDGKGGSDALTGGGGKDRFDFTSVLPGESDAILDFNVRDDTIGLDDSVFGGLPLGSLARGAFVTGTAARQADDRIIFDAATGHLSFDPDGAGGAAQIHFATLTAGLKLTAADFVVI